MGEEPVYCMDEGPDCTVEGPAVQVEEPVHPPPCLGRQSRSIVYSGDGCVSRGEKNHRFWRHAMRDFGGAPELLLIKNKRAPHTVLMTAARSTAPREVNSQLEDLTETVSGATESASKSEMVSGITESKSEIVSGVSQNASKKKKNKDEKKRKSDGQSLQSHSAPQLSPAFGSSLKDDENTTATVGESGPSYPLLPDKGKELAPCSDTPAHSSMQGPNAKPLGFSSLRGEFCHTRIIRFMGRKYRILLQDKDGPCSLIAICKIM